MLGNEAHAATTIQLLDPISAANTAAATGDWFDVRQAKGDLMFAAHIGALTGSITWSIETASDVGGTGAVAITPLPGAFSAGAANQVQKRVLRADATKGFVRVVGTIVTGPALVAASVSFRRNHV